MFVESHTVNSESGTQVCLTQGPLNSPMCWVITKECLLCTPTWTPPLPVVCAGRQTQNKGTFQVGIRVRLCLELWVRRGCLLFPCTDRSRRSLPEWCQPEPALPLGVVISSQPQSQYSCTGNLLPAGTSAPWPLQLKRRRGHT